MISKDLMQCLEDMRQVAEDGKFTLEALVRAYDLTDTILDMPEDALETFSHSGAAEQFCQEYARLSPTLDSAYDHEALLAEVEGRLAPLKRAVEEAEMRSKNARSLHECAKTTYDIWQTKGVFSRYSALRKLRSMAGFRLESDRIGNYVAKTFDLMNEANAVYARAQQAVFAADVAYKVKSSAYSTIASKVSGKA